MVDGTVTESGREERSPRVGTRISLDAENNNRLTWDATTEPGLRDHILRRSGREHGEQNAAVLSLFS